MQNIFGFVEMFCSFDLPSGLMATIKTNKMNTQTNSIRPVSQNIETFIAIAKNWKHTGDFSPIAKMFMYDLSTLKGSKIWSNRVAADECIKRLKGYYILDANATIDELENEILTRFNNYKIDNPKYYKQTEFTKAFEKVFQNI
jgi:hypothetical protein